jgi:peptidoglycan/LPS O-acetylase OafA/YrhL
MLSHFWLGSRPFTETGRAIYAVVESGWIGVDLFFVLSGFLITGILLDAKGSDGYFRNFYARRALRIFPLYYGFLVLWFFVLPRVFGISPDATYAVDGKTQWWFWTYLSNFLSVVPSVQTPHGLNHFWTLAVEEQFYIVWPAVVLALSDRRLRIVCLAMIPAGLLFRLWLMTTDYAHTGGYVLTPARMGTLALGAWLASAIREPEMKTWVDRHALKFLAGSLALLAAINFPDMRMEGHELAMQTVGFPLLAVFGAAVIVFAIRTERDDSWYQKFFRARGLRFFGKYSYGMYVLHLPIVVCFETLGFGIDSFAKVRGSDLPGTAAFSATALVTTTVAACISWHLYEKRFLVLKKHFTAPESSETTTRQAFHLAAPRLEARISPAE